MIELLGVGIPRDGGGWLVRGICASIRPGELTAVVSRDRLEGQAIFDALTGRSIPVEGRIWVNGVPLMRETAGRVRSRVGEARLDARLTEGRFALYSTGEPDSAPEPMPAESNAAAPDIVGEIDYTSLTLAQLRARLPSLRIGDLEALLDYEGRTKARAPFQTLLDNRITRASAK